MINIHSITFKFTAIILSASLLFLIIIGSLTTQLVIDQYESMEQNKLETIADNVTETLALNISYGFDKAIQETADTLYQNKQVLYLCIKDLKHDISKNSREGKSFTEYQKLHHFMLDEELLDPISQENIGSIQLIYSRSLFDTMILHYYNKLAFIMGIFLFFLMIFSFFLHRTMKPLSHLAYEMNNFDPKAPTNFDFTSKDRCEIGLIARASNRMYIYHILLPHQEGGWKKISATLRSIGRIEIPVAFKASIFSIGLTLLLILTEIMTPYCKSFS